MPYNYEMDLREIDRQTGRKTSMSSTLFPHHVRTKQKDNHNFGWPFQSEPKSMDKSKAITTIDEHSLT